MNQETIRILVAFGAKTTPEELTEIDKLKGRRISDVDHWATVLLLINQIVSVQEYYPALDDPDFDIEEDELEPDPDTCNVVLKNGLTWGVKMPFERMARIVEDYYKPSDKERHR